jgi:molybdopterin synthase sulfur carrier subunit
MSVTIRIPTPLRRYTKDSDKVQVDASTVGEALERLEAQHPGIKDRICDEKGALRRFVNIYYKEEDIRFLDNVNTQIEDGSELSIVPAIAGGR